MNKFVTMLVALVVTLFAMNALAFNPPPAPARGGYVVDQTGKLSDSQIQQLNRKIDQISKSTKNEFGILFLRDMGGDNIEDVANSTFRSWGVGKHGLDNGCLIVVSLKERKSRIETGKGVEGDVPDLRAHDILQNNLNPHLKRGDFYGGFDDTLSALASLIESRHNQKAEPRPINTESSPTTPQPSTQTKPRSGGCSIAAAPGTSDSGGGFWIILSLLGGVGLASWYLVRRARLRAQAEAEAELEAERARQRRVAARQKEEADARRERLRVMSIPTPVVAVPAVPQRTSAPPTTRPAVPRPTPRATVSSIPPAAAATAAASALASQEALQAKLRRERDEQAAAKRRRERDEEDRRKRQREEDDRRSSSSSSSYSSYSSGSSSSDYSSGGGSSGGGFGGGDSGGGGSSSDW